MIAGNVFDFMIWSLFGGIVVIFIVGAFAIRKRKVKPAAPFQARTKKYGDIAL